MKKLAALWKFYKNYSAPILFAAAAVFVLISNLQAAGHRVYDTKTMFLADGELFPELTAAFASAESEIACALYMFKTDGGASDPTSILLSALRDAIGRGVKVRMVLDMDKKGDLSTQFNTATAKSLKAAGAEIIFDDPDRRMHTKMCVIDGRISFIGSHNYTYSALRRNSEVTVRIESAELAEDAMKYIEMFGSGEER